MSASGTADRVEGMRESYGARGEGASVRALQRVLATRSGRTAPALDPRQAPLEVTARSAVTPPRCVEAPLLEGTGLEARSIAGEPVAGISAFLDGIQRSVVAWYERDVIPVVHATTAAVIRVRQGRDLHTWGAGAHVERCAFLPFSLVEAGVVEALSASGFVVVDTVSGEPARTERHPQELVGLAREAVKRRREAAEEGLVTKWCATERTPLYVDGAIRAFGERARREMAVGVVKSHNTVYVASGSLPVLARLKPGERSSALRIDTRPGVPVASWYLRLHASDGRDPFSGLVRVEVSESGYTAAHADTVSRWILAEREPAALPDARWRVMAYGIRDCEEYLRAITA